jgi:ketosteroid isomerase-like protein
MSTLEFGQHSFALLRAGLGGDTESLATFCDLFADDAQLWLPPTPNTLSPYRGTVAIRTLLSNFVPSLYQDGLHLRLYQLLTGTDRVLFQFEDRGTRPDGSNYENSPCIALQIRGEQIGGFWEYWGGPGFFRDRFDGSGARGDVDDEAQATARQALTSLIGGMGGSTQAMDAFLALLADDVRLWFPPTPNTKSPYIGRAEARELFCDLLMKMYPQGMAIEAYHETSGGTRTAFELQSRGVRADGSIYANSPCLCLDVKAGKIQTLWEHWGGPGFHRALVT